MNLLSTKKHFRGLLIAMSFVLTAGIISAKAQRDLITTHSGQEIRCRIIDETPARFVYSYIKGEKVYRSEIFKNLVSSFKYNFYDTDLPFADKMPKSNLIGSEEQSPRALSSQGSSKTKKVRKRRSRKNKTEELEQQPVETNLEEVVASKSEPASTSTKVPTPKSTSVAAIKSEENEAAKLSVPSKTVVAKETEEKITNKGQNGHPPRRNREEEKGEEAARASKQRETPVASKPTPRDVEPREAVAGKEEKLQTAKPKAEVVESKVKPASDINIDKTELPNITINQNNKFRVGVKGGIGNRLDNSLQTTNTYDLYLEQLLRGYVFGADLGYFPTDGLGYGFVFTDFRSRNSDSNITYQNAFSGNEATGSIANRRSVKFVGPALFLRKKLDYKTYVVLGLSPGYNFYTDNGDYNGLSYTFKGGGFGAASTLGVDFLLGNDIIGRDVILSFEAGYNYGKINALNYGDSRGSVTLANPISINRLDFTVGLRFIRFPKYFRLTSY